jgi:hypothetical protein
MRLLLLQKQFTIIIKWLTACGIGKFYVTSIYEQSIPNSDEKACIIEWHILPFQHYNYMFVVNHVESITSLYTLLE